MANIYSILMLAAMGHLASRTYSADWPPAEVGPSDVAILIAMESHFCSHTVENDLTCPAHFNNETINEIYSDVLSSLPVLPPSSPSGSCCFPCSCMDDCVRTDTCCPEIAHMFPNVSIRTTCVRPQLRPTDGNTYSISESAYYMLRGCSIDQSDRRQFEESIRKCEHPEDYNDLDVKVPVTNTRARVTYINRYCALCNSISEEELVYWKAELSCGSDNVAAEATAETIVEEVLKTKTCTVVMRLPDISHEGIKQCDKIISACNVSGLSTHYDKNIEEACKSYTRIFDFEYRNIFCYMCNEDDWDIGDEAKADCSYWNRPVYSPNRVSFSALLQIRPREDSGNSGSSEGSQCGSRQMFDVYTDMCRNLTCFPPRVLKDGECTHPFEAMSGVFYRFFLKLTPLIELKQAELDLLPYDLNMYTDLLNLRESDIMNYFKTRSFVKLELTEDRNETLMLLQYYLLQIDVDIAVGVFVNESLVTQIMAAHNSVVTTSNTRKQDISFSASFIMAHLTTVSEDEDTIYDNIQADQLLELGQQSTRRNDADSELHFEVVIPPNLCPLVDLQPNEFNFIWYQGGVYVEQLETNISRNNYVHLNNSSPKNTIYVCKKFFQNATEILLLRYPKHSNKPSQGGQALLTIVCASLSIFCSIITLITYILFKELRTQPGINNMMLTSSLICAQLLFQFGIDQEQNVAKWVCQLIGALIHFSWFLTLMWMNVCSIHMFKVFRSLTQVSSKESIAKTTFMYTAYCFTVAIVPVVLNIALSKGEIGYGGDICYIESYTMNLYLFFLPVGIVVVVNMFLFFGVIFTITRMPKIDGNTSKNRNFAKIYIKISSLTGITWLFGFLFAFTEIEVFEYIFIVLNAGLGVFIFLSFVCNKRVFTLYKTVTRPVKSQYTARTQSSNVGSKSESKTDKGR